MLEAFKKAKPHSPINYEVVVNRVAKYIQLGRQIRKELWMPMNFQLPTLLWPLYDNYATRLDPLVEEHLGEHWKCTRGLFYTFKSGKKGKTKMGNFKAMARKYNP